MKTQILRRKRKKRNKLPKYLRVNKNLLMQKNRPSLTPTRRTSKKSTVKRVALVHRLVGTPYLHLQTHLHLILHPVPVLRDPPVNHLMMMMTHPVGQKMKERTLLIKRQKW